MLNLSHSLIITFIKKGLTLNSFGQLEITIKKIDKEKFKASAKLFPKCIGTGKNEKEALKNLSTAIAKSLSKTLQNAFEQIICSDNFTELVLDLSKQDSNQQHRIFNLDNMVKNTSGAISLKIKSSLNLQDYIQEINEADKKLASESSLPHTDFLDKDLYQILATGSIKEEDLLTVLAKRPPEGFIFGLPLNFN